MLPKNDFVIHYLFAKTAAQNASRVAIRINRDGAWEKLTYKELNGLALKVAGFLSAKGFVKNDSAAIILENRPEWPAIYMGLMYAGLTCVPLDPQLSGPEIKNLVLDSGAKLIFCSSTVFAQKIKADIIEGHVSNIVVLDASSPEDEKTIPFSRISENSTPALSVFPDVSCEDAALLVYTSGTTQEPKGVLLSHKNIISNFNSISKIGIISPADNLLSILPLYHTYALMVTLITPLLLGGEVTYCASGFKPQELAAIIKDAGVSIVVAVPRLLSLFYNGLTESTKKIPVFARRLAVPFIRKKIKDKFGARLRLFASGGARLEPKIAKGLAMLFGIKVIEGYGLTETSPVVTFNPLKRIKFGSVGKPLPDVEVKIDNPDRRGVGEVLIKGPNVMRGYFKHPELTAEAIKNGWFYSGDLGYLDKEGYLFLLGRSKDVIVLDSGKNIYPEELEEYYSQAPCIKDICIMSKKEIIFGQPKDILFAVVVPNFEVFKNKKDTNVNQGLRWDLEMLEKKLPSYKHVMGFTFTSQELPRTALRKLQRFKIKEFYANASCQPLNAETDIDIGLDNQGVDYDVAEKIIQYLSKQTHRQVNLNSHLEIDLGIDSLARVELGLGIESIFKIKIPDETLSRISTIKELVDSVSSLNQEAFGQGLEGKKDWSRILEEPPSKETLKEVRIEFAWIAYLFSFIGKQVFLFLFRIIWFLRVRGRNNLPLEGPYLICANHASFLDGLFIILSLPFKIMMQAYFLGLYGIFKNPGINWTKKFGRLVFIDNNVHLVEALRATSYLLSREKIVCLFPEGIRSIDDKVKKFQKGVGILIKELDVLVVPAYIKGSHQSWGRGIRFPRPYPVKVIFGQPISLNELLIRKQEEEDIDDYEVIARRLRDKVVELSLIP